MNSVRSKSLSLKYQKCSVSGCKDIGIRKVEFVAKTQFHSVQKLYNTTHQNNSAINSYYMLYYVLINLYNNIIVIDIKV